MGFKNLAKDFFTCSKFLISLGNVFHSLGFEALKDFLGTLICGFLTIWKESYHNSFIGMYILLSIYCLNYMLIQGKGNTILFEILLCDSYIARSLPAVEWIKKKHKENQGYLSRWLLPCRV